jgi:carboxylesterase type B
MLRSLLALSALLASAAASRESGPRLLVRTTSGLVQGHVDDTNATTVPLLKWFGIRFAADTAGANRFRPPQPVVPAPGIFNATHFGPACLQGQ